MYYLVETKKTFERASADLEVCNPQQAAKVLRADTRLNMVLPGACDYACKR